MQIYINVYINLHLHVVPVYHVDDSRDLYEIRHVCYYYYQYANTKNKSANHCVALYPMDRQVFMTMKYFAFSAYAAQRI